MHTPGGISRIFKGVTGRVLMAVLAAHAALIPVLFGGVFYIVSEGYKTQFIDQARATSYMLAILAGKESQPASLQAMIDEMLWTNGVAFMDVADTKGIIAAGSMNPKPMFREDFYFGQNLDSIYFVSLPAQSKMGGRNLLRVGFDETSTQEQIDRAFEQIIYLAVVYISFVGLLVFLGGRSIILMNRELVLQAAALEHQATHDALTNLPNRFLLHDRLHQAIRTAERDGAPISLLLLDLNRFKEINDTLGHQTGDDILRQVSARLQEVVRKADTVARLGGDEFSVVLPTATITDAIMITEKIVHALKQSFRVDDRTLEIGASIGIALFPEHGGNVMNLLRRADVAMYIAKQEGKDFVVYDASMDQHALEELTLANELRQGIERGEFEVYYQPKVDLGLDKICGVEALVRWHHPRRGLIQPAQFMDITERTGIIHTLSMHVLDLAAHQCKKWHDEGLLLNIAVNLSPMGLMDTQLAETVRGILHRASLDPAFLILEITEGPIMSSEKQTHEILTQLAALGISISVDDFGTGHSTLGRLKKLPVSEVKIDKSFVFEMLNDSNNAAIVRTTIDLAQSLGLRVVAEGVETQQQYHALRALKCDMVQGYYISRPVPADGLRALCHEYRRERVSGNIKHTKKGKENRPDDSTETVVKLPV